MQKAERRKAALAPRRLLEVEYLLLAARQRLHFLFGLAPSLFQMFEAGRHRRTFDGHRHAARHLEGGGARTEPDTS